MKASGEGHAPADLRSVKTRDPLCRRLGGPQVQSGREQNILPPLGFDHHVCVSVCVCLCVCVCVCICVYIYIYTHTHKETLH